MRILAVDYGDARTGLSVCDKLEMLAVPLCVIHQTASRKLIQRIAEIVIEEKVELIVLGYPKNMDSSIGSRAQKSEELAVSLKKATCIDVVLWDESLTTVSAHTSLKDTTVSGKKRKNIIDAVAATIILQDYLNYRKMNKV
ncbi:MAG: Holliday junction resolvase RuvX [Clostridiales bacterium]|nr:Holliday junction resolvase RuvX [Clostridiales bacterium]